MEGWILVKKIIVWFLFSIFIISYCDLQSYAEPTIEIHKDTIEVRTEKAGDFSYVFEYKNLGCKYLKVFGIMDYTDFIYLDLCATNLKAIELSGVTAVSEFPVNIFISEENLESFIFPSNLKNIGSRTFISCTNLKNVVLPKKLECIGRESFQKCPNLNMMVSCTIKIGEGSFYRSPGVTIVEVEPEPMCGCCSWLWQWLSEDKEKVD